MYGIRQLRRWIFSISLFLTATTFIGAGIQPGNSPTSYVECVDLKRATEKSWVYHFRIVNTVGQYYRAHSFLNFASRVFLEQAAALIRTKSIFRNKITLIIKYRQSRTKLKLLLRYYQNNKHHYPFI